MKALTVRQPWASLIVAGIKPVECRSWATRYRGPLGIHAGLAVDREALAAHGHLLDGDLPLGAVIGTVELVDCVVDHPSRWAIPGHRHWVLAEPRRMAHPRAMHGRLGLWELADGMSTTRPGHSSGLVT